MYLAQPTAFAKTGGGNVGTGWLPPYPDRRDYTERDKDIPRMAWKLGVPPAAQVRPLPEAVDLRPWCSPIEHQGNIGSCTAHAAVGVIEYFQRRAYDRHIDASRLFVYKVTRTLMRVKGDTGAWLRSTMAALRLCGAPPEKYWPYTDAVDPNEAGRTFDDEPPAFVYAVAENFEATVFFCHDPSAERPPSDEVLKSVKRYLAAGVPAMFGFYGFPSANDSDVPGAHPVPAKDERAIWGHAVVAVGYDDRIRITNTRANQASAGALLIRNSWGETWGEHGYGWLPYEYVLQGWALDFWSLVSMAWIDTGQFGLE